MATLFKTDGTIVEITPENGKKFNLKEAQGLVGGLVELINLGHREMLICNEEGIINGLPYNHNATMKLKEAFGPYAQHLYGDIILCKTKEF